MRTTVVLRAVLVCALLAAIPASAQNPFEDAVKQLASQNVKGYLQPFVNSFGANLNSGMFHTASIPDIGITFRLEFVGALTLIGDAEKVFTAMPPYPFDPTPVQTATVFGGEGASVTGPGGISYKFQNGQINTSQQMLFVPQATIGNVLGTQAVIRYIPLPEVGNFPKVTIFGVGAHHSISRYIPGLPVDIAAGASFHSFTIGDIFDATGMNIGAQVSKSMAVLTAYGGLQYEKSSIDVTYQYTGYGSTPETKIGLSMEGENTVRATLGVGVNLMIANINADVNIGKVTVFSGSIGFGL